jgi:ribosome-associated translation inhibitor RaiA
MEVNIVATNLSLEPGQQTTIEQRAAHALDRFAHEVRTLQIVFSDENGPKGGEDTTCQVKAVGDLIGTLVARSTNGTPEQAAADALRRANRQIADVLDKTADRAKRS